MTRMTPLPAVSPSRETTEAEQRARAREHVEQAASRGEDPRQAFSIEDLKWAGLREAELDALAERAAGARAAKADRTARAEGARELRREIERAESELLEQERQDRRKKAEAIARERLGL